MRRGVVLGLVFGLVLGVGAAAGDEAVRDRRLGIALKGISQSPKRLDIVRIEVSDGENRQPSELVVYGTGVGVWNRSQQFEFEPELVQRAAARLHEAGFAGMAERVVGPSPTPTPTPTPAPTPAAGPNATQIMSAVTVVVGDLEKTVYQDNKTWRSPEFAKLRDDLIAIFREPARKTLAPKDLGDALAKLQEGGLHRELLEVTVNAPEQRELASQDGQGWLLRIRHGQVEARLHRLGDGYTEPVRRRLTDEEARALAADLRAAGIEKLPQNLDRAGYTDLTVGVLGFEKGLQARAFAGREPAADAAARASFDALRSRLETMCREMNRQ